MKPTGHLFLSLVFVFLIINGTNAQNQSGKDSTGLPGDNFSLQGALEMFQKAGSPEEFEKLINTPDNHINNLDLNGDGDIDYIRVIDNSKDNAHAFVLQDVVSDKESQDVAVIELEKTGDTTATLQIVGDEDLYGEQIIAEPNASNDDRAYMEEEPSALAMRGPNAVYQFQNPGIFVNVWFWPCVRFVYVPTYVVWRSPWRWHYYPMWWRPWRPFAWYMWHPFHYGYERRFAIVTEHRVMVAHRIYAPLRVTSVTVHTRNQVVLNNYRVTRTRTTVTGPRGNQYQRTTTTVQNHRRRTTTKSTRVRERKRRR